MVGTVAAQPSMRHWVAVVGGACALLLAVLLGGYLLIRGDLPDQVASRGAPMAWMRRVRRHPSWR